MAIFLHVCIPIEIQNHFGLSAVYKYSGQSLPVNYQVYVWNSAFSLCVIKIVTIIVTSLFIARQLWPVSNSEVYDRPKRIAYNLR